MPSRDRGRIRAAWFGLIVALAMAGMWAVTVATGAMPELRTERWSAVAHLAAEFGTAAVLLVSSLALLRQARWAWPLHLAGLGMLIYAVVQASGYFVQQREPVLVLLFALLAVMAILDGISTIRRLAAHPLRQAAVADGLTHDRILKE